MKYTNKTNLPKFVQLALESNEYDGPKASENIISVTTLLDSPYIHSLKIKHKNDITKDVSDQVWSLFGTAFHNMMEQSLEDNDNFIVEKRLTTIIDGITISGSFDMYDKKEKMIVDYKTTSTFILQNEEMLNKYKMQLNIYALLAELSGIKVNSIANLFMFKDHNAKRNAEIQPIQLKPQELMDKEEILSLIKERLKLFKAKPKSCTESERWYKKGKKAVMKKGRKKAIKLFDEDVETLELAKYIDGLKESDKYYIEDRNGEDGRCEKYCEVKQFCEYYKQKGALKCV